MAVRDSSLQERTVIPVADYDLAATLSSGQAFRWIEKGGAWEGVVASRWVRLRAVQGGIEVITAEPVPEWQWIQEYLQTSVDLAAILSQFPPDPPLREAVAFCQGLRLLRQDPWECLASFILSSTKQIVQIQQIVRAVCRCFGRPVTVPDGAEVLFAFPSATELARVPEEELRGCKMGFRAPYLRAAASAVAEGDLDLAGLAVLSTSEARCVLTSLPGVGDKIANCVLLFAYGRQDAFPVDVWVAKALRQLYFPKRRVSPKCILHFSKTHFGPYAGYAQQYLFHYMRKRSGRALTSLRRVK